MGKIHYHPSNWISGLLTLEKAKNLLRLEDRENTKNGGLSPAIIARIHNSRNNCRMIQAHKCHSC
ncbi:MAG: hypothetical protein ACFE9L_03320 [Candidatus Hodarchaeota archaeon]